MNSLLSAKLIWGLLTIGSVVGITGSIFIDQDINSTAFMNDNEIEVIRSFSDFDSDREVASLNKGESFTIPRIVLNNKNQKDVNGVWEITRITNDSDVVVYDTYRPADKKTIIELPLKLVATSEVKIDKDEDLKFYILFMHESKKTISLIRPFGKGYEIVEAKRSLKPGKVTKKSLKKFESSLATLNKDITLEKDEVHNMSLDKVIFPNKTNKVLKGSKFSGEVIVKHNVLDNLSFTLNFKNNKGKQEVVEVNEPSINIDAGGMFHFDYRDTLVNGIVTKNGKAGYRIRFITGKLQGASLNFVTEDEAIRIQELKDDAPYDYDNIGLEREDDNSTANIEADTEEELVEADDQEEAGAVRKISQVEITGGEYAERENNDEYYEDEGIEEEENLTEQSVENEVQKSGFNFAV